MAVSNGCMVKATFMKFLFSRKFCIFLSVKYGGIMVKKNYNNCKSAKLLFLNYRIVLIPTFYIRESDCDTLQHIFLQHDSLTFMSSISITIMLFTIVYAFST